MYRILVIIGLLVLLYFLVRRAVREFRRGLQAEGRPAIQDEMVQDPVCRLYVPRDSARVEKIGGQIYFFCSKECAQTFQKQGSG